MSLREFTVDWNPRFEYKSIGKRVGNVDQSPRKIEQLFFKNLMPVPYEDDLAGFEIWLQAFDKVTFTSRCAHGINRERTGCFHHLMSKRLSDEIFESINFYSNRNRPIRARRVKDIVHNLIWFPEAPPRLPYYKPPANP